jgi:serine/threonine protein kinase
MVDLDDDEKLGALFAAGAEEPDPVAIALSRARTSAALFGSGDSTHVARFRVLERLGAGGMGVVYTAYDPELDRAVALKLVRVHEGREDEALHEAKALARLSHPNVVPVHDVGILDRHVFIVMELVRGQTLARWAAEQGRSVGDLLRAYLEAGAALAAAHAAGLVHRDFKPDNAIVGLDGRVRVVDFGLASESADGVASANIARAGGTPKYMAPEQAAGRAATPAADQFSFCAALRESLKDRSIPRAIEVALARGRSPNPADRYPSMNALLAALSNDPRRVWIPRVAVLAIAIGVLAAFGVGRVLQSAARDTCAGGGEMITRSWAPDGRVSVLDHVATLSDYSRSVLPRLDSILGAWEHAWVDQHRDACLAHQRGEQSEALLDLRMACLEQKRASFSTLAETLRMADAGTIAQSIGAASTIQSPISCAELNRLLSESSEAAPDLSGAAQEIRKGLERVRVLQNAARVDIALEEGRALIERARSLGDRRLLAEAMVTTGAVLLAQRKDPLAEPMTEALDLSLAIGADDFAVDAWSSRAFDLGTTGEPKKALEGREIIEAIAMRPTTSKSVRTRFLMRLGGIFFGGGNLKESLLYRQRAVEEARGLGPEDANLIFRTKSALASSDPEHAEALLTEVLEGQTRLFGADHPDTLATTQYLGAFTQNLARAHQLFLKGCERMSTLHPGVAGPISECWAELAQIDLVFGDREGALYALRSFSKIRGTEEDLGRKAYLELLEGRPAEAAQIFAKALKTKPPADAPFYDLSAYGELNAGYGLALKELGATQKARAEFELALQCELEVSKMIGDSHPHYLRRLAWYQAELSLLRAQTGADRKTTATLAKSAYDYLSANGSRWPDLAKLDALSRP